LIKQLNAAPVAGENHNRRSFFLSKSIPPDVPSQRAKRRKRVGSWFYGIDDLEQRRLVFGMARLTNN
jgi:hypothetical protein